jgi:hypothetical protein
VDLVVVFQLVDLVVALEVLHQWVVAWHLMVVLVVDSVVGYQLYAQ